jgi:2-C-methyl-D-erythritol 4-phosphate cytidylyltransferase / 2-C-methyl-D-erythritol 2,4-cyclodiphosphate synthase
MLTEDKVATIIVAAGSGERLAAGKPKALVQVLGKSLLELSFARQSLVSDQIIITYPPAHLAEFKKIVGDDVLLVPGGADRDSSVKNALKFLADDIKYVLIHDCARALASTQLSENLLKELQNGAKAVIPTMPVTDTIKEIKKSNFVKRTPRRNRLRIAQTPQAFTKSTILQAHHNNLSKNNLTKKKLAKKIVATDDAMLVEKIGVKVKTIPGEESAFKITFPSDLQRAARYLSQGSDGDRPLINIKTGIGSDTHVFDSTRPLWLGGLYWPAEAGLAGHSDADVALHAICDAIFAATDLGDLGANFGVDKPEFKDASGSQLLKVAFSKAKDAGYEILNISLQIIGNQPKISPRRAEIAKQISQLLDGVSVTVTATTTDGLGFTGEGKGLSAIAIATVSFIGLP